MLYVSYVELHISAIQLYKEMPFHSAATAVAEPSG